mgnify:CR=1 FL=1
MNRIPSYLRNKYAVASVLFLTWLLFFDRNDLISQLNTRLELNQLLRDKTYFLSEIRKNREQLNELMTNPANLEKFARERYLMKKDNEDIFVF